MMPPEQEVTLSAYPALNTDEHVTRLTLPAGSQQRVTPWPVHGIARMQI